MDRILERDWKAFRELHATALERQSTRVVAEVLAVLQDDRRSAYERAGKAAEILRRHDRILQGVFDDFRRSTAAHLLVQMVLLDLLEPAELARLSDDLRAWVAQAAESLRDIESRRPTDEARS